MKNILRNASSGTLIRTLCLLLALVNLGLETAGKKIIPITDDQISGTISFIFTVITSITGFWKNNSFTDEAVIADELMHELKAANKEDENYYG